MGITFTINQALLLIGAANGLVLAFLLFSKGKINNRANLFLGAIVLIFSINIILHTISHGDDSFLEQYHSTIIVFLFFLFGPLFYFYVKILTGEDIDFKKRDLQHLFPFTISIFLLIIFSFTRLSFDDLHLVLAIITGMAMFHVAIYMLWNVKLLIDYSHRIKQSFSNLDKINLRWLRFLMIAFTAIWILAIYFDLYLKLSGNWDYVWLLVSIVVYLIGYMGLKNPQIFSGKIQLTNSLSKNAKKKYEKSTLTKEMAETYLNKLENFMREQKPFLKGDLTLPELSTQLNISVHHLSQVINEKLDRNFFEYINNYRVEEAKRLLADDKNKHLSLVAIGADAGFNSNSSFVSVFKSFTNMTPSQYRNSR